MFLVANESAPRGRQFVAGRRFAEATGVSPGLQGTPRITAPKGRQFVAGGVSPRCESPNTQAPEGRQLVAGGVSPRCAAKENQAPTGRKIRVELPAFFFFLSFIALFLPACQTPPTHAEAKIQAEQRWSQVRGQVKLQLARQQFERGQFDDAIKTLQESTALDPVAPDAYAMLAKANLELGKPATAEQALQTASKLGLKSAELEYLKGVILEQRNELSDALAQYEKACDLDPTRVEYFLARIEVLVALNRLSEARTLADANAATFDDDASVALLAARIALLAGDSSGALERFQNPAIQNAASLSASEDFAALLAGHDHCSDAIRMLEPFVSADPESPSGRELSSAGKRTLANCYIQAGQPQQALALLARLAAGNPADTASQLLLARAALAAGEYMAALQALEAARQGHSTDADFDLLLATTHWKRGDLTGALGVLDRILAGDSSDVDAWCLKGEVLGDLQRTAESRDAFERAVELDPGCRWALEHLAQK